MNFVAVSMNIGDRLGKGLAVLFDQQSLHQLQFSKDIQVKTLRLDRIGFKIPVSAGKSAFDLERHETFTIVQECFDM